MNSLLSSAIPLLFANMVLFPLSGLRAQDPVPEVPLSPEGVSAQKNTIQEQIEMARRRTGREVNKVVQLTATGAQPYPTRWDIRFYDPASPTYLSDYGPDEKAVPAKSLYAEGTPPTYFDLARVKLDVNTVFKLVDKAATEAKVGYDQLDYTLRAREFSQEPVWTMRLVNHTRQLVGLLELSAESGRTYRSIWLHREGGDIRVVDSALSSSTSTSSSASGSGVSGSGASGSGGTDRPTTTSSEPEPKTSTPIPAPSGAGAPLVIPAPSR